MDYSQEEKAELADIVLRYRDRMLAEECEPEEPEGLWMKLTDWFEAHPRIS